MDSEASEKQYSMYLTFRTREGGTGRGVILGAL